MTTRTDKDKAKQLQDKCQSVLNGLLRDEDNKYCVDCDSKGPRWASWNIGVFLCIRCAGIHRNLGVHISKVKSVNLDAWRPEQVVSLQQMGNSRARAVYEANLPDNFRRPQSDSSLETFIRTKYEHKKYIAREWVPPAVPQVNWEKEIDEEIEKQKRKKKTIVEKRPLANVEVPQLPKPMANQKSPKAARAADVKEKREGDLLGLHSTSNGGDDSFTGFLSAVVTEEKQPSDEMKVSSSDGKTEEENFFNQTMPTEKEKAKLTKDSILALYASVPPPAANSFNQPFNQPSAHQLSSYPNSYPNMQHQGVVLGGAAAASAANRAPNGVQPHFGQWPQGSMQQNWFSTGNQFASQYGTNQFANFAQMQQQQQPVVQVGQQFGSKQQQQQQQQQPVQQPNPFFANQSSANLQQQLGNLNLGGAPTTNIWQ